jgi:hypothetical protein
MKILIGTPVFREGAFALDKFLINQQQIQEKSPDCELILATCEIDFITELTKLINQYHLRGAVLPYEVNKPQWSKHRIWNITSGRESIRLYMLSRPEFEGLLFLDADMTFDPLVVNIMERELKGYDAVFCGYHLRSIGTGLAGAGCLLLPKRIMKKIRFRCYEFKNGNHISEDNVLEVDLFRSGARVKKGFFMSIDHYFNSNEAKRINPQKISLYHRITNFPLVRYCLIKAGIIMHYNLSINLFYLTNKIIRKNQGSL